MPHGGKRSGAACPEGSENSDTKEIRDIISLHKPALIQKAIDLALDGNVPVLNKLLDKIIPTMQEDSGKVSLKHLSQNPR